MAFAGFASVDVGGYHASMTIELPDKELDSLHLTSERVRLETAAGLYATREITLSRGARIAGISYTAFLQELGKRGIAISYSEEDALRDIETVRRRTGK
jgi:predicted HTH domain antitoxin